MLLGHSDAYSGWTSLGTSIYAIQLMKASVFILICFSYLSSLKGNCHLWNIDCLNPLKFICDTYYSLDSARNHHPLTSAKPGTWQSVMGSLEWLPEVDRDMDAILCVSMVALYFRLMQSGIGRTYARNNSLVDPKTGDAFKSRPSSNAFSWIMIGCSCERRRGAR